MDVINLAHNAPTRWFSDTHLGESKEGFIQLSNLEDVIRRNGGNVIHLGDFFPHANGASTKNTLSGILGKAKNFYYVPGNTDPKEYLEELNKKYKGKILLEPTILEDEIAVYVNVSGVSLMASETEPIILDDNMKNAFLNALEIAIKIAKEKGKKLFILSHEPLYLKGNSVVNFVRKDTGEVINISPSAMSIGGLLKLFEDYLEKAVKEEPKEINKKNFSKIKLAYALMAKYLKELQGIEFNQFVHGYLLKLKNEGKISDDEYRNAISDLKGILERFYGHISNVVIPDYNYATAVFRELYEIIKEKTKGLNVYIFNGHIHEMGGNIQRDGNIKIVTTGPDAYAIKDWTYVNGKKFHYIATVKTLPDGRKILWNIEEIGSVPSAS